MQPPEVRNESYPRGYQLLPGAPLSDWRQVAAFDNEAACEEARQRRTDEAIDRARAAVGEDDAKYDLDVRRAVQARCVTPRAERATSTRSSATTVSRRPARQRSTTA